MDFPHMSNIIDTAYETVNSIDYDASFQEAMLGNSPKAAQKKFNWKKPVDRPKRPLSAYNIYFQLERERIIHGANEHAYNPDEIRAIIKAHKSKTGKRSHRKTHGKISFTELAKTIANRWKVLDAKNKELFQAAAAIEKDAYLIAVEEWKSKKEQEPPMAPDLPTSSPRKPSPKKLSPRKVSLEPGTQQTPRSPADMASQGMGLVSPDSVHQKQVASLYQGSGPNSDSLYSLVGSMGDAMNRNAAQNRYQVLIEQQIESELLQKQLQREIMMANAYGRNMPAAATPQEAYAGQSYYNAAQQTYDLMQMTLPAMSPVRARTPQRENRPAVGSPNAVTTPELVATPIHTPERIHTPEPGLPMEPYSPTSSIDDAENIRDTFEG